MSSKRDKTANLTVVVVAGQQDAAEAVSDLLDDCQSGPAGRPGVTLSFLRVLTLCRVFMSGKRSKCDVSANQYLCRVFMSRKRSKKDRNMTYQSTNQSLCRIFLSGNGRILTYQSALL